MSKLIAFPARARTVYPTFGALALAPQEIEDAPGESPTEAPKRQVDVTPFPGAWDTEEERPDKKTEQLPGVTFIEPTGKREGVKTRIGGSDKNSEIFSGTYVDPFFPLAADVYRLASRSPPKLASGGSYAYNNPLRYWDPSGYFAVQSAQAIGGFSPDGHINNAGDPYQGEMQLAAANQPPPGWNENWEKMPGTREGSGMHDWDPEGGEWRWHEQDKYHPESHWDYNQWDKWNSPWQNVPAEPQPQPQTPEVAPIPWWEGLPFWIPGPLPLWIVPPDLEKMINPQSEFSA